MLVSFTLRSPLFGKDHVMCRVVSGGRKVEMWTERVTVWFITAATVSWSAIIAGLSAITLEYGILIAMLALVLIMPYQSISQLLLVVVLYYNFTV